MAEDRAIRSAGMRLRLTSDIGSVIRNERRDRGLTQSEMASLAGVSRQWLSDFENGKDSAEVGMVLKVLRKLRIDLMVAETPPPMFDHERFRRPRPVEQRPDRR